MDTGNPLADLTKATRYFVCTDKEREEDYLSLFLFIPGESGEEDDAFIDLLSYEEKFGHSTFNKNQVTELKFKTQLGDYVNMYDKLVTNTTEKEDHDTFENGVLFLVNRGAEVVYPGEDLGDRKNTPITDRATVKRLYQVIEELTFIRENTELNEDTLFTRTLKTVENGLDNLIEYAEENLL